MTKESEKVKEWRHERVDCKILKYNSLNRSWYCGYVKTGLDFNYDDVYRIIDVHGGITHCSADGWTGFDCAHAGDLCLDKNGEPMIDECSIRECYKKEWSVDDVVSETEKLARQIAQLEELVEKHEQ